MPFQRVTNSAEIIIDGSLGGQNYVNTFYAQKSGGYDAVALQALADAVDDWFATNMLPIFSNEFNYRRTTVRGLDEEFDLTASQDAGAGVGGIASASLPNNAALSIKRSSGLTGRGARGRVYIGGLPQSGMDALNIIDTVIWEALQDGLNLLRDAIDAVSWTEVIVHRVAAGAPLPVAVVFTVVEYIVVNTVIDSMRRRLPGRGS